LAMMHCNKGMSRASTVLVLATAFFKTTIVVAS
jgi:hypothetical protein